MRPYYDKVDAGKLSKIQDNFTDHKSQGAQWSTLDPDAPVQIDDDAVVDEPFYDA
ncbi:hypothetical protein HBI49_153560 [Parastagonospora nodorum]|nr:hypothetical protein HBH54_152570 [Parastagonospora nodorum]KAH4361358.1 hypothetical protein HBH97_198900 [Parastagonospora nodorum]KAH4570570.1 hypothetical protein HBH84_110840 [Parastagonospora nodorum]KAH5180223.1 hypothetical protein HBH76_172030 [Parastagonospora nodorum]KAH5356802.1 hypothetical protein HBI49_153560 [Parastagonospora nodorum]